MKKILSMILAVLLIFSVAAPISVFAENGPYPYNPDSQEINIYEFSSLALMDIETYEMGILYPSEAGYTLPDVYSGASYDLETNTLTLKNVKSKTSMLSAMEMGDDFKINLIGYNELGCIISMAESRGGSITITGDGELVLNRNKTLGGIYIDAGETASVLHVEDTAKLKIYSEPATYQYAVAVYGSTVTDTSEIIKLGGTVVAEESVFEKYIVDIYEQLEAYDLEWNSLEYYDAGFQKDGVYYIGFEDYNELTWEPNGKYELYSISYDELLDCYVATSYTGEETIKPSGFTKLTEYEPIYDSEKGLYIGYTDYAEEGDNSYKDVFYPEEKDPFDLCVDENGTKYGFWQYTYEYDDGTSETDTYIYNLVEHPVYGWVAIEDESKTTLDGFTPIKIGEKELADSYISSDLVINNGGAVVEPATIKGITLKNTNQGVKISWTADSSAQKYRIYRKADGAKKWTILDTIDADETFIIDKTAKSGTKYYYTVRGYNYVGWGSYNTKGVAITHIGAPEVTVKNTSNGIYLKWTKIANAEKYRIYRQTEGSSKWTRIDTVTKTSFTDKTVKSGTKYNYRVRAVIGDDMGSYEVVGRYYLSTPKLSSVKNSASGVKVTWEKVSGAEGYKIYRKTGSGDWKLIGTTTNNKKFTYTDKTAKSGKTYSYSVQAYYSKTKSTYSKTGLKIKYLAAPKTETKVYTSSINISWNKISGAKEYAVYRKANGESKWTKLTTTQNLSYKDTSVKNNKTYSYRVKAINGKTVSGFRTVKQLFLATPKLSSVKNTNSGVVLKWNKVSGAEGYKIYRKTGSGDFKLIATTTGNKKFTYTDGTTTSGKVYTYTVKAYNENTNSYYNKTGLKIRFVDANALYTPENEKDGVLLRFEPADKADKYHIYREVDGTNKKIEIAVLDTDKIEKDQYGVFMYIDETAKNGETYAYYLRASYKGSFSDYMSSTGLYVTRMEPVDVLSAKATSEGIKIKWEKNPCATSYTIYRKEKGTDENFSHYYYADSGKTTTAIDCDVVSGKTYYYAVRANYEETNKNGWAVLGESKSAKAK